MHTRRRSWVRQNRPAGYNQLQKKVSTKAKENGCLWIKSTTQVNGGAVHCSVNHSNVCRNSSGLCYTHFLFAFKAVFIHGNSFICSGLETSASTQTHRRWTELYLWSSQLWKITHNSATATCFPPTCWIFHRPHWNYFSEKQLQPHHNSSPSAVQIQ